MSSQARKKIVEMHKREEFLSEALAYTQALAVKLEQQLVASQEKYAELLSFVKGAPVSSGVCCCGESMDNHPSGRYCGHTPVDQWDHAVEQLT